MQSKKAIVFLLLSIFLVGYSFISTRKQLKHDNDFPVYYDAARAVINSENIYLVHSKMYVYPPTLAIMLVPLTLFSLEISTWIWYWMNIAALFGVFYFGLRILPAYSEQMANWGRIIFLTALFSLRFIFHNMDLGQVNLVILFLIVCSLFLLSKGKAIPAGMILSLGISVKVTPLLLLLYFIYKKEVLFSLGVCVGLFSFLLVLPSIFLGLGKNLEYLCFFYSKMIMPFSQVRIDWLSTTNQSLLAALGRFLTDSAKGLDVNLLSLSQGGFRLAAYVLAFSYLFFLGFICRGKWRGLGTSDKVVQYSLVLISMLLLSGISEKHHFVLLIFPYLVCFNLLFNCKANRNRLLFWVLVSFVFCSLTSDGLVGRRLSEILLSFSAITAGVVALFVGLLPYARTEASNA